MKAMLYISLSLLIGVLGGFRPALAQELVGLQNVSLKPDELLWGFDIQPQEGRIVAVCNVPEGWTISAENYGKQPPTRTVAEEHMAVQISATMRYP
jgi:hypothetical protein